ncbi:MAG: citrate synthase [Gammaproteobacteria bacterium]|nr:citrate synthase [Gammaproteobacteria bacterium]
MAERVRGLAGVPATESEISDIDGANGILMYRGYPIEDLAKYSTFEETTLLLLDGKLPSAESLKYFSEQLYKNRYLQYHIIDLMKTLPGSAGPMAMLQTAVSSLAMFYPGSECLTGSNVCTDLDYTRTSTFKVLGRIATMVAAWTHIKEGYNPIEPRDDLNYAENFLYMLNGNDPEPFLAKVLDVCLILHAEHTINASTFSVMVNGSTLSTPYSVISGAIGCLSGPLHGGANSKVLTMLREIGHVNNVEKYIDEQLESKRVIWGMGHREYKTKDPRATILEGLIAQLREEKGGDIDPLFDIAKRVEEVCADRLGHKGVYPNVDFYSGLLYKEMGIPEDQFTTIFAIARSAGWMAHWREQLADNTIFRPTQYYKGEKQRSYVTMSER